MKGLDSLHFFRSVPVFYNHSDVVKWAPLVVVYGFLLFSFNYFEGPQDYTAGVEDPGSQIVSHLRILHSSGVTRDPQDRDG